NYLWEQMAADELIAGVIADLQHLPASVLKVIARAKGKDRVALVSDAVALGGLKPGIYDDGRHEVLPSGRVNLAGTPYLAGAGHLLDTCLANAYRHTDYGPEVLDCVTVVPSKLMNLGNGIGVLREG